MTTFRGPVVVAERADEIGKAYEAGHSFIEYVAALYDFAQHGGAVGVIGLGVFIPADSLVLPTPDLARGRVITVPTSGGAASISVGVESAADINAADVISGVPWSTTGLKSFDQSTGFLTTVRREVNITIAVAALTAGRFRIAIPYLRILP